MDIVRSFSEEKRIIICDIGIYTFEKGYVMHELSVTTNLLNLALSMLEEQQMTKIHTISLKVGVMQGYEEKWLQHYFDYLTKGTPAEGAV